MSEQAEAVFGVMAAPFRVYHWDTFDNQTLLVGMCDTLAEAMLFVHMNYNVDGNGADRVDIVNAVGDVVRKFYIR